MGGVMESWIGVSQVRWNETEEGTAEPSCDMYCTNTYCLISYWKSWVILNKGRRLSHLLPGSDLQQHVKEKEAREEVLRLEVGIKVWSDHRGFMQQVRGSLILSLTWVCNNGTLPHFSLWRTSLQLVAVKTQVGHLSTQSSHSVLDLCVWLLFQSSWFKKKKERNSAFAGFIFNQDKIHVYFVAMCRLKRRRLLLSNHPRWLFWLFPQECNQQGTKGVSEANQYAPLSCLHNTFI